MNADADADAQPPSASASPDAKAAPSASGANGAANANDGAESPAAPAPEVSLAPVGTEFAEEDADAAPAKKSSVIGRSLSLRRLRKSNGGESKRNLFGGKKIPLLGGGGDKTTGDDADAKDAAPPVSNDADFSDDDAAGEKKRGDAPSPSDGAENADGAADAPSMARSLSMPDNKANTLPRSTLPRSHAVSEPGIGGNGSGPAAAAAGSSASPKPAAAAASSASSGGDGDDPSNNRDRSKSSSPKNSHTQQNGFKHGTVARTVGGGHSPGRPHLSGVMASANEASRVSAVAEPELKDEDGNARRSYYSQHSSDDSQGSDDAILNDNENGNDEGLSLRAFST